MSEFTKMSVKQLKDYCRNNRIKGYSTLKKSELIVLVKKVNRKSNLVKKSRKPSRKPKKTSRKPKKTSRKPVKKSRKPKKTSRKPKKTSRKPKKTSRKPKKVRKYKVKTKTKYNNGKSMPYSEKKIRALTKTVVEGGRSSMREDTRYDKTYLGRALRYTRLGGQPPASTKPHVTVTEPAGCNKLKWEKKELPWASYLNYFGQPVHTWAECTVSGKNQFLHYTIGDGYCCQSTEPPQTQAQEWIRNLGIPGLIEMAPHVEDLKTYIQLSKAWNLNEDQRRHMGKLKSKILAFEQMYNTIKYFAHNKFDMGMEFDKELPVPRDDNSFYMTALGYAQSGR